jgi:hypothetical protein
MAAAVEKSATIPAKANNTVKRLRFGIPKKTTGAQRMASISANTSVRDVIASRRLLDSLAIHSLAVKLAPIAATNAPNPTAKGNTISVGTANPRLPVKREVARHPKKAISQVTKNPSGVIAAPPVPRGLV